MLATKEVWKVKGIAMVEQYKNIGKIRNSLIITVTAKAESLSLTIPKDLCEVYNIIAGDKIQVAFLDHFKKIVEN